MDDNVIPIALWYISFLSILRVGSCVVDEEVDLLRICFQSTFSCQRVERFQLWENHKLCVNNDNDYKL
jgi:hypothetical protein